MQAHKVRDLTLIKVGCKKTMIIACDSCGGAGNKEYDILKVPPFFTGKFTARVAVMEVLCSGAEIIAITNCVCNEMNDTGLEIIKGIKDELLEAGINNTVLTGSTEENFKTLSTGLGVTVIGIVKNKNLKLNRSKEGSAIISIGLPKVGGEIKLGHDDEIINYKILKKLLNLQCVYEIVPVGSKGVLHEANTLAKANNLNFKLSSQVNLDIYKSAGPSTVIIAAVKADFLNNLYLLGNVNLIGSLL
mgnify:CR=1 FL=1